MTYSRIKVIAGVGWFSAAAMVLLGAPPACQWVALGVGLSIAFILTEPEAHGHVSLEVARVLDNVRPEIRPEVAHALELAAADTSERSVLAREAS